MKVFLTGIFVLVVVFGLFQLVSNFRFDNLSIKRKKNEIDREEDRYRREVSREERNR